MSNKILVHLVIIGKNPHNGEYSIGLVNNKTVQTDKRTDEPEAAACSLALKYIKAPLDWYEIRKHTFVSSEKGIHLIYVVTVPENIKLKNEGVWHPINSASTSIITDEVEKDIIIQGIRL